MTSEQQKVIDELRAEGYAIAIFYPDEIKGASSSGLEDIMIERGTCYIEDNEQNEVDNDDEGEE